MKILPAVVFFLVSIFITQLSFCQEISEHSRPASEYELVDTTIALDPSFITGNRYAVRDSLTAIRVLLARAARMQDTTILVDPSFIVLNVYAIKDSLDAIVDPVIAKRNAIRDSLNLIGNALMRTADMQDTIIYLDPSFIVRDAYAKKDSLHAIRDSLRVLSIQAAQMQDTTIEIDPSFTVIEVYAKKDRFDAMRDSIRASLAQSEEMQDTTIEIDPSFKVLEIYAAKDRSDAIRDSIARPTIMRDTVIVMDPDFVIRDLYPLKDSLDAIRDSLAILTDSLYTDSLNRHWAGWKKYEVETSRTYILNSQKLLKGKSKSELQYNIADFYLYLNGDPVKPPSSEYDFFPAGFLGFRYDDTLLLNSGLGSKLGIGVGIKIFQDRFTSSLHANTHNEEVYKSDEDDTVYMKSMIADPVSQSLSFQSDPAYFGDVIIGEYQATYKKFYQKNEDGQDEQRQYRVRIVFRCRVSGGINSHLK